MRLIRHIGSAVPVGGRLAVDGQRYTLGPHRELQPQPVDLGLDPALIVRRHPKSFEWFDLPRESTEAAARAGRISRATAALMACSEDEAREVVLALWPEPESPEPPATPEPVAERPVTAATAAPVPATASAPIDEPPAKGKKKGGAP